MSYTIRIFDADGRELPVIAWEPAPYTLAGQAASAIQPLADGPIIICPADPAAVWTYAEVAALRDTLAQAVLPGLSAESYVIANRAVRAWVAQAPPDA